MFEEMTRDTVGYFGNYTLNISPNSEYYKFGFIDVRSVPPGASQEEREDIMKACKDTVDKFAKAEFERLGKL